MSERVHSHHVFKSDKSIYFDIHDCIIQRGKKCATLNLFISTQFIYFIAADSQDGGNRFVILLLVVLLCDSGIVVCP